MLRGSLCRLTAMSVPAACRVMGFTSMPHNKRILRRRFVQLVKERHPDQNTTQESANATQAMVQLTEAYALLRRLVDDKGVKVFPLRPTHNTTEADSSVKEAEEFRAPGVSLSMRGMSLPWQRNRTFHTHTTSTLTAQLARSTAVDEMPLRVYLTAVRTLRQQQTVEAARGARDDACASGSHGYTSEYFASIQNQQNNKYNTSYRQRSSNIDSDEVWLEVGGTSSVAIVAHYYRRKLQRLPRKIWHALTYILLSP